MGTTTEEPTAPQSASSAIDVELPPSTRPARAPRVRTRPSGPRRTRVTVRRFGLWSVFKFSLLFSLCMMLVLWLALLIIFLVLQASGVMDTVGYLIGCVVSSPEGTKKCVASNINGGVIFTYLLFAGIVLAAAVAGLITFMSLIYNLISDIIGGVEVTLSEKRL